MVIVTKPITTIFRSASPGKTHTAAKPDKTKSVLSRVAPAPLTTSSDVSPFRSDRYAPLLVLSRAKSRALCGTTGLIPALCRNIPLGPYAALQPVINTPPVGRVERTDNCLRAPPGADRPFAKYALLRRQPLPSTRKCSRRAANRLLPSASTLPAAPALIGI